MQRRFKITVDGREYEVAVEEVTDGNTLIPQPGDMHIPEPAQAPVAPPSGRIEPPPRQSKQPGDLCSPLAGVVVSLSVVIDQQVEAGEQVAVVEAMKMKTSIVAQHTGKVTAIAVTIADAVEAGQILMSIE